MWLREREDEKREEGRECCGGCDAMYPDSWYSRAEGWDRYCGGLRCGRPSSFVAASGEV